MISSLDRVRVAIDDPSELVSATLLRIGYRPTDAVVVTTLQESGMTLLPGASVMISLARARSGLTDLGHLPHGVKACVTLFVSGDTADAEETCTALMWVMRHYDVVAWCAVSGASLGNIRVRDDGRWEWHGETLLVGDLACSAVGNAAVVAGFPFRWDSRDAMQRWAHPTSQTHIRLLGETEAHMTGQQVNERPSLDDCSRAWDVLTANSDEVSPHLVKAFERREFRDATIAACLVGCDDEIRSLSRGRVQDVFSSVFTGDWSGRLHPDAHAVVESLRFSTYYVEGAARWNVLAALALIAWACRDTAASWELCHEIPAEVDVSLRDLLRQAMSVGLNIRCNDVA